MKAIALISGGLDSILAAKLIQKEGIEIIPVKFKIPFLHTNKKEVAGNLGVRLKVVDISDDFLRMLEDPAHGYGTTINPCIDCKIMMLSKARELMPEVGAAFIVTGEVLGQRPMSQNKQALDVIVKSANLAGLVVRPLSAKLLAETLPEKEEWIKRQNLLDLNGRSRKSQIELAEILGIKEYAQPAGGCLLTDPEFSRKVKDLIEKKELNLENVKLLKVGRHFRLSAKTKLVVGRDEKENALLISLAKEGDCLFEPTAETAGPTALGRGLFDSALLELSCSIVCRYCDLNGKTSTEIVYKKSGASGKKRFTASCIDTEKLSDFKI